MHEINFKTKIVHQIMYSMVWHKRQRALGLRKEKCQSVLKEMGEVGKEGDVI